MRARAWIGELRDARPDASSFPRRAPPHASLSLCSSPDRAPCACIARSRELEPARRARAYAPWACQEGGQSWRAGGRTHCAYLFVHAAVVNRRSGRTAAQIPALAKHQTESGRSCSNLTEYEPNLAGARGSRANAGQLWHAIGRLADFERCSTELGQTLSRIGQIRTDINQFPPSWASKSPDMGHVVLGLLDQFRRTSAKFAPTSKSDQTWPGIGQIRSIWDRFRRPLSENLGQGRPGINQAGPRSDYSADRGIGHFRPRFGTDPARVRPDSGAAGRRDDSHPGKRT